MSMTTRAYRVKFLTPAFLGNAEQSGQWRTPPFKALLRQWWRAAWSAEHSFRNEPGRLRDDEARLFGSAANDIGNRSLVRLRLDRWDTGRLGKDEWPRDTKINHPEVTQPVGSALYLGFGPLTYDRKQSDTGLKCNAAIQAGEAATLRLAFPQEHARQLDDALGLMAQFGTVGGRSRNGWGSFVLEQEGDTPLPQTALVTRTWREALDRDWPHAIGADEHGPLIWRTQSFDDWQPLMRRLAEIKIALRTHFAFPEQKPPHPQPLDRHWLSYPVTKHTVAAWRNFRLPNSLRFKVRQDPDGSRHGLAFHVPCLPPPMFKPHPSAIENVWQQVHHLLDADAQLARMTQ